MHMQPKTCARRDMVDKCLQLTVQRWWIYCISYSTLAKQAGCAAHRIRIRKHVGCCSKPSFRSSYESKLESFPASGPMFGTTAWHSATSTVRATVHQPSVGTRKDTSAFVCLQRISHLWLSTGCSHAKVRNS